MSNLSDLLPAGGGAKVITATASGNLATGQTVILQSDGTVKAVEQTSVSQGVGSEIVFSTSGTTNFPVVAYDTSNDKIVVAYRDGGDSNDGKAVVGTVSGSSISFGSPVTWETDYPNDISIVYDSANNKVVIIWGDGGNSGYGTARVGTVSGTSISFGTATVFNSGYISYLDACFTTKYNFVAAVYRDQGTTNHGMLRILEVSGTSITAKDSANAFNGATTKYCAIDYDPNNDSGSGDGRGRCVIAYQDDADNDYGKCRTAQILADGSTNFQGSEITFESATTEYISIRYDSTAQKFLVAYRDGGNSNIATARVLTINGNSVDVGTAATISGTSLGSSALVYDPDGNVTIFMYRDANDSNSASIVPVTISGTSVSFGTSTVANAGNTGESSLSLAYDTTADKTIAVYRDDGNSLYGTAIVFNIAGTSTNSGDFVGITNQAINNSASGEVVVEGGVITNGSLLPSVASSTFGSESVFENATTSKVAIAYDTGNDKVVIAYRDEGDSSKGKAVVGTVSGTSITFGTPVDFEGSDSATYEAVVYDPDEGKVIITWASNSTGHLKAIVGTVSGTTMSFGSPVTYEASAGINFDIIYDTSNDKVVVCFKDGSNSNYGTAIVGTVSGTSISFGTKVVIQSANLDPIASVFDSTNNKVLFAYRNNSTNSQLIVGTVSGTSISFGSPTTYVSGQSYNQSLAHDTSSGKNVLVYRDTGNSNYGTAVVATVSGTSVSIGTAVVFNAAESTGCDALYDPTTNATFVFYKDAGNSDYGTAKGGIINGTDISFGSASVFNTANPGEYKIASVKDPDQNKAVIAFIDTGNSNYGTAIVGTLSSAVPNFTIGSTYYVQDNGTLATTSSSVTAGKAIANTTLLLKG